MTLTPAQQRAIDAARAAQQKLDQIRRDEAAALKERDATLREHADVIRDMGWAAFERAVGADGTTGEPVIDRDTARKVIGNP